jgi:FSR family fosmidomycin resistance protein-like MFS transporter
VAALGVVLAGLSHSYLLTWIAIALCGLGIAAYHPPATVAARAAGGASQKAMSVFSVGGTIGASFAPVLAATVVGGGGLARSYLLGAAGAGDGRGVGAGECGAGRRAAAAAAPQAAAAAQAGARC